MIILVGESASGKSSIERYLVRNYGYEKIVSYTTRQPREEEIDGVDYYFITDEEFNTLKSKGFFAEYAVYNNWQYGTSKNDYNDDKVVVLTPHGLRQIKRHKDIIVTSFYISVPRRERLIALLRRGDSIEEAYRRNLSDVGQFDGIVDDVDFVIDNTGYMKSASEIADEIFDLADETSWEGKLDFDNDVR